MRSWSYALLAVLLTCGLACQTSLRIDPVMKPDQSQDQEDE